MTHRHGSGGDGASASVTLRPEPAMDLVRPTLVEQIEYVGGRAVVKDN
ncbi:MAG: hypothetical protein ABMB14_08890 [Myxococcota bacterium]